MKQNTYTQLALKKGKERSLTRRHPWIFSGAFQSLENPPSEGEIVQVCDVSWKPLVTGIFSNGSIAVRILAFGEETIDLKFWKTKINEAIYWRTQLGFFQNQDTNVFRLMHGEGDQIPGLILDWYNGHIVMQCHTLGIHLQKEVITKALSEVLGDQLKSVYDKSRETLPRTSQNGVKNSYLLGQAETPVRVTENGHQFLIDWISGQKTGFFIDQRENRNLLAKFSQGKKVLNLFSYSSGFSVYALNAGASLVHSVDSSAEALELGDRNVALTPYAAKHKSIKANALDYIQNLEEDYDVFVLDPPAFAKHIGARHKAVKAYKYLNALVISKAKSGSVIFTFSCSQVVDKQLFTDTIRAVGIEAGKNIRILHQLHQPADHPVNLFHPESEYLKGLVLAIE